VFGRATALYERAQNWAIGSDPGLLRLRMAARTTASLAVALLILFLLTKVTHQPLTVALLGVLITMVAGRAVNEPEPRKQKITMALLSLIGSKQFGGRGYLPYGWDMLAVIALSLVFYYWGVNTGYRTEYLDERETEDEILEGVGV